MTVENLKSDALQTSKKLKLESVINIKFAFTISQQLF